MQYFPLNYEQINIAAGRYNPSMVKSFNNEVFWIWERALFQRACSTLIITMPEVWKANKDLLYWCLFAYGYVGCGKLPELGKWFNPGTFCGYDFYYRPTTFLLCNPYYKGKKQEFTIGKDCELIKLTPDYYGIWEVITYYAEKLAVLDVAINTAIINSNRSTKKGRRAHEKQSIPSVLFPVLVRHFSCLTLSAHHGCAGGARYDRAGNCHGKGLSQVYYSVSSHSS